MPTADTLSVVVMASMDQNDIWWARGWGKWHGKADGSHAHDKSKRQNCCAHDDLSLRIDVRQNGGLQQAAKLLRWGAKNPADAAKQPDAIVSEKIDAERDGLSSR